MLRALVAGCLGVVAFGCGGKAVTECPTGSCSAGDGGAISSAPTSIASEIQLTPIYLASDGTSLFWLTGSSGGVSSMPAGGGTITTIVAGPVSSTFLAVDNINVYYLAESGGLYRSAKGGGLSSTLISTGATPSSATVLGGRGYWVQSASGPFDGKLTVNSAPLQGGAVSLVGDFTQSTLGGGASLGITTSSVFVAEFATQLASFPIGGSLPDGGVPAPVPGPTLNCGSLVSDTDAVYCGSEAQTLVQITSDGTMTTLGTFIDEGVQIAVGQAMVALDERYIYWVVFATDGTIMRAPKTGGTATVLAHDTSPVAIAVDDSAVYWSDQGGNIMRLAK